MQTQLLKEFAPFRPCCQQGMSKTWQRHPEVLPLQLAWLDTPASASDILRILNGVSYSSSHSACAASRLESLRDSCLQDCLKIIHCAVHLRQNMFHAMPCHSKTHQARCCLLASTDLLCCLAGPEAL